MDNMLEEEKKAKQSIIESFTNILKYLNQNHNYFDIWSGELQSELKAAEESLNYTQQQLHVHPFFFYSISNTNNDNLGTSYSI